MQITILCDSDHAHDRKTQQSITGIICYIGSTPVIWLRKRQGAVAIYTYAAEFMTLRHRAEEIIHLRYMLCCLGTPVTKPSNLFGDNLGVIQNAINVDAELKKKHVSIPFYAVCKAIAAGILTPYWLKGKNNISDIMTKQIGSSEFLLHVATLFWKPNFIASFK